MSEIAGSSSSASRSYPHISPEARSRDLVFSAHKPIPDRPIGLLRQGGTKAPGVLENLEKPEVPENYENDAWLKLQAAVKAILSHRPIEESLEELYKDCKNLCSHKMAASLYSKLFNEIESHVTEERNKLVTNPAKEEAFLFVINNCWEIYCSQMQLIRSIFLYLDRTYVFNAQGLASIWDKGLQLFRKHIMVHVEVGRKVLEGTLGLIRIERDGFIVNRTLVKTLISMYSELHIYYSRFEVNFLTESREYYKNEGRKLVKDLTVPKYLLHVMSRLQKESKIAKYYLEDKTSTPLIKVVEDELIKKHVEIILSKGFEEMMYAERKASVHETSKKSHLSNLYSLLSRVNSLDRLRTYFGNYIKKTGMDIVNDPIVDDPKQDLVIVEELLVFKDRIDDIVQGPFVGDYNFEQTLKEGFETFINQRNHKPAELIAKYIDRKLKIGNKKMSDKEIEKTLNSALVLFRYIQGKDVFEGFYKRDLAKRLLMNKCASDDYERSMLINVDQDILITLNRCSKISILRDSKHGEEFRENFKIDLHVNALTQVAWPSYSPAPLILPPNVAQCQRIYETFYREKARGKGLKWYNNLGHCVLSAYYPNGNKEFEVTLFQAVVLLLFAELTSSAKRSYEEIKEATGMEEKELRRTLITLTYGKVRLLIKHPKGKDINTTDQFSVDDNFSNKYFRIKINTIQMERTMEENQQTVERAFLERHYQIDACAVRIMKMRKSLTYTELTTELLGLLTFNAEVQDIKKRIETLIDREYLERDKDDPSKIKYLA
ncbi:14720_t:CDS:10 [Acaulospora morrowiae]|uniref:14720_t:CDS:1 n=1 Tax=Acaulospora morrowiae TaxID=94023 RepID=A0A9N9HDF2_9GLOM|nr:14720_t:CDS:10 [Acaulospora morrowiae]